MKDKIKKNVADNKINKKKIILIVLVFLMIVTIFIFIFAKMNYKNKNIGHNMSNKNLEEIEKYILDISSYQAKMEITVESNKNTNKYLLEQTYQKDKISKQKVLEPSNIEGLEITFEAGKLSINHSKLNLTTIYENYTNLASNCLWLDSFIEDYKQGKNNNNDVAISEQNNIVTMETKTRNENNRYIYNKQLIIDKKTGKPTKLLVQDINKKNLIYILYNEMEVNNVK